MKFKIQLAVLVVGAIVVTGVLVDGCCRVRSLSKKPIQTTCETNTVTIQWCNDAVVVIPKMELDAPRNGTNTSIIYYVAWVPETNKVDPLYLNIGADVRIELGARSDGVIVWRKVAK